MFVFTIFPIQTSMCRFRFGPKTPEHELNRTVASLVWTPPVFLTSLCSYRRCQVVLGVGCNSVGWQSCMEVLCADWKVQGYEFFFVRKKLILINPGYSHFFHSFIHLLFSPREHISYFKKSVTYVTKMSHTSLMCDVVSRMRD